MQGFSPVHSLYIVPKKIRFSPHDRDRGNPPLYVSFCCFCPTWAATLITKALLVQKLRCVKKALLLVDWGWDREGTSHPQLERG